MMIVYFALAFLVGGFVGIIGMAILASGPRDRLIQENRILKKELDFLVKGKHRKQYKTVKDPRERVHTLVN